MPHWVNSQIFFTQLQTLLQRVPLARVRQLAVGILLVWLISMLADVFWRIMPEPTTMAIPAWLLNDTDNLAGVPSQAEQAPIDVSRMQAWYLFGKDEQKSAAAETTVQENIAQEDLSDAQETRLNLRLLGLMQSSGKNSYAIIEANNKADLYHVGDSLPVGQNIKLARVLNDRAIIDNRGKYEALLLYDENEKRQLANSVQVNEAATQQVVDQRQNRRLTQMAGAYRERLMSNPMSLMEVIRFSIAKDNAGNVLGYRVFPGRDRKQFSDFGLKNGDIITAVNGVSLEDPSNAMELYNQLRTAREANFSLQRDGQPVSILVRLADP